MPLFDRRAFLERSAAGLALAAIDFPVNARPTFASTPFTLGVTSGDPRQAAPARLVVSHASIVDVEAGHVVADQDVEIEGSTIASVRPAAARPSPGPRIIDGRGRYLMPGLWDSHVHLTKCGAGALSLLLAHGITSVRDMGSDIEEVRTWRREIDDGRRPGPQIRTPGPILESRANVERMLREQTVEPVARLRIPVGSPEEGRAAVKRQADAGVDFLKIRTVASPETLEAIADAARTHGLALAGHAVASLDVLARLRFASVEHVPAWPPLDSMSREARRAAFDAWRTAGVRMGTTTVNLDGSVLLDFDEASRRLASDPMKRFLSPYLAADWAEQIGEKRGGETRTQIADFGRQLPSLYRDLREMHEAGVQLLAGSDAAVVFMYPGPALHGELASLVRHVGLSPAEALRCATVNPARLFGLERELGLVKAGFIADLVLLDGNPLERIDRTSAIAAVFARGVYHDKAGLQALLDRAARDAR